MSKLLGMIFSFGGLSRRHDDDLTDRLVCTYSTTIFIVLGMIVKSAQYVGSPINCWAPAQFTGAHCAYTNAICLISSTYQVPFHEDIPKEPEADIQINYYIWVPFILFAQALLCVLPSVLWKSCYRGIGFNVPSLIERLENSQNIGWERRETSLDYVVANLQRYTGAYRHGWCKSRGALWCCLARRSGNYLALCHLAIKFLYFILSACQFVILNFFLGMKFNLYGFDMMQRAVNGEDWQEMKHFPRVTLCNFEVRHMHRVHPYTVQCALPINLFNEKIFLFVWFWLLLLSFATCYSFLKWCYLCLFWKPQIDDVKLHLKFIDKPKDFKNMVREFTTQKLRRDALFVLRLLSQNVGTLATGDVLKKLWDIHYPDSPRPQPSCPPSASIYPRDSALENLVIEAADKLK